MGDKEPLGEEGAELSKKHLLGLLVQFKGLSAEAASKRFGVPLEQVNSWASELEREGWITISPDDASSQTYSLTKDGLSWLKDFKKTIVSKESYGENANPKLSGKKSAIAAFRLKFLGKILGVIKSYYRDIVLLISTLASIFLLYTFIKNPNAELLSFFLAVMLFSIALLLYNQYKRHLKTQAFVGFIEWFIWIVKSGRRYLALIATYVLLIYVTVIIIIYPAQRPLYLMLFIMLVSTSVLLYNPKKISDAIKFYIGMALLMYAVLLISSLSSITMLALNEQSRLIDVAVGFCLIVLVQSNEERLGVGVKSLRRMLKDSGV